MANRLTVQESVNPFTKALNKTATTSGADKTKAVQRTDDSGLVTVVMADGNSVAFWFIKGEVFNISITGHTNAGSEVLNYLY